MYWQICSPIMWVVILFLLMISFAVQKLFNLIQSHLFIFFSFVSLAWGDISNKILLGAMSKILLPMFSSNIFMVQGLTFKYLIYSELFLVCGLRRLSSLIFLHVSVQFSQLHLLNKISLAHCIFLCQIVNDYKGMGSFLVFLFCSIVLWVLFYASAMLF